MNKKILEDIHEEIKDIFYSLVKVKSDTGTFYEKNMEPFFMSYFGDIQYFKKNPQYYGKYAISGDPLNRTVLWAMIKGEGDNTIVFMNHYDVVDIEDFKTLADYAYSPRELEKQLFNIFEDLPKEAKEDLESGDYIFGRGTADMKAGMAIQMALMKRYSQIEGFKGNILFLSVPDEENISAGMRSAIILMDELKERYGLNYIITINSEPHQRVKSDTAVLSEGSVGKIMPFIYVRGYLSHVGKVFEGFNPIGLLSRIINNTELNLGLSDFIDGEASPPPTWLRIRDSKNHYDVSMPLSASAYISVQTLNKDPVSVLEDIKFICIQSFLEATHDMNEKYKIFRQKTNKPFEPLPWDVKVVTYKELYDEAYENHKEVFKQYYDNILNEIQNKIISGEKSIVDSNFELVEGIFDYIDDLSPRVVIGFAPPYYPNVSNINIKNLDDNIRDLSNKLMDFAMKNFNQKYEKENFFTGISDLSYTYIENSQEIIENLKGNMPFYGNIYSIPLDKIEKLSMPCMNIGPWGKDFHKLTERVLKEDLFNQTPKMLNCAVSLLLNPHEN